MGVAYNPRIVTDGLILALDSSNPKSYSGSGTAWFDISGKNNNGTISNGEFVSAGKYFQNSSNVSNTFYVTVPDSASINAAFSKTTGGWTIEELVMSYSTNYPEADAGSVASTVAYGATATGFDWNHGMANNQFMFGVSSGGGSGAGNYDKTIILSVPSPYNALNAWKLRTMIWDRTNDKVSLYINGTFIGEGSIPEVSGQTLYDGGGIVFGSLYGWRHYGRRAFLRVYDKVLSPAEINQNFNALRGRFGI